MRVSASGARPARSRSRLIGVRAENRTPPPQERLAHVPERHSVLAAMPDRPTFLFAKLRGWVEDVVLRLPREPPQGTIPAQQARGRPVSTDGARYWGLHETGETLMDMEADRCRSRAGRSMTVARLILKRGMPGTPGLHRLRRTPSPEAPNTIGEP